MSLFREWVEEQLPIAEASLKHCDELLAEQRERVAERKRRGIPSREADKLLKLLESSRELHLRRVENLRRDLERKDSDLPTPYPSPQLERRPLPEPY